MPQPFLFSCVPQAIRLSYCPEAHPTVAKPLVFIRASARTVDSSDEVVRGRAGVRGGGSTLRCIPADSGPGGSSGFVSRSAISISVPSHPSPQQGNGHPRKGKKGGCLAASCWRKSDARSRRTGGDGSTGPIQMSGSTSPDGSTDHGCPLEINRRKTKSPILKPLAAQQFRVAHGPVFRSAQL